MPLPRRVLDTPAGLVAVLSIGMAQISPVVMTAEAGKKLHKGEAFAYLQFGGSDIVVLFKAACSVGLMAQPNVHDNQGSWLGQVFP
ncbi:phosphatidylserine decarboxylase [Corallococcus carmarthensis]|uniref:phosphatidylserine decarboxylase n=1 Tax=Corallococcus carmarthensis TaxID=2316728 RepID=UPI001ABF1806|nr:phosphatidylserine decarboxylase [Corallococcus carmarthensis]